MGYMKWIKMLMDDEQDQLLELEIKRAHETGENHVIFDKTYMDLGFAQNVLNYIKNQKENESRFNREQHLPDNQESRPV